MIPSKDWTVVCVEHRDINFIFSISLIFAWMTVRLVQMSIISVSNVSITNFASDNLVLELTSINRDLVSSDILQIKIKIKQEQHRECGMADQEIIHYDNSSTNI